MDVKQLVYKMLTESTGAHMLDSGGAYGRHWERNQKRTLQDFVNDPEVTLEYYKKDFEYYTISVFHYLTNGQLELDGLCDDFNTLAVKNWDSEIYGVSKEGADWLKRRGFEIGGSFNTYNGESALSQVLQGTYIKSAGGDDYVLLQIHNGCDVRGGYTDAKMFSLPEGYLPREDVFGSVTHKGKTFEISNIYDGVSLRIDANDELDGKELPFEITKKDKLELSLMSY